jgi:hypothetical protein
MPYDEVEPAEYDKWEHPLYIKELRARSAARVTTDREFRWISDDLAHVKEKIADNKISLDEKARREEMAADKAREDKRTAERTKHPRSDGKDYLITLDNLDKPNLELVTNETAKHDATADDGSDADDDADSGDDDSDMPAKDAKKAPVFDPIRNETLNILSDYIEISHAPRTASVNK